MRAFDLVVIMIVSWHLHKHVIWRLCLKFHEIIMILDELAKQIGKPHKTF